MQSRGRVIAHIIFIEFFFATVLAAICVEWWEFVKPAFGQLLGAIFASVTALSAAFIAWIAASAKVDFDEKMALEAEQRRQANVLIKLHYWLRDLKFNIEYSLMRIEESISEEWIDRYLTLEISWEYFNEIEKEKYYDVLENIAELPLDSRNDFADLYDRLAALHRQSKTKLKRLTEIKDKYYDSYGEEKKLLDLDADLNRQVEFLKRDLKFIDPICKGLTTKISGHVKMHVKY